MWDSVLESSDFIGTVQALPEEPTDVSGGILISGRGPDLFTGGCYIGCLPCGVDRHGHVQCGTSSLFCRVSGFSNVLIEGLLGASS
jgi:hypothetical protein